MRLVGEGSHVLIKRNMAPLGTIFFFLRKVRDSTPCSPISLFGAVFCS